MFISFLTRAQVSKSAKVTFSVHQVNMQLALLLSLVQDFYLVKCGLVWCFLAVADLPIQVEWEKRFSSFAMDVCIISVLIMS